MFTSHKKRLFLGFSLSIFEVTAFFLIAFFMIQNAQMFFAFNPDQDLLINILLLTPLVFILPLMGKLGDRYNNKPLFLISAIGTILTSIPLYLGIMHNFTVLSLVSIIFLVLFTSIQFALIPALISSLYPTSMRFTCVGFSFNLCDSFFGGLVPLLGTSLIGLTHQNSTFIALFPITAIIFLIAFFCIRKESYLFNPKITEYQQQ